MHSFSFEAIGTHWKIDLYNTLSTTKLEYLTLLVHKKIDAFERSYSRFRSDSYINLTLSQLGNHTLPSDAKPLFDMYKKLYEISEGVFTPLIGQVLIDAGYDAEYSLEQKKLHTPPPLEDVMNYSFPQVTIKREEIFDFGAAGKGYLIDLVSQLIHEAGVASFCIDAGGDIRYESTTLLRVGLENPSNTEQAIGVVTISNTSLCASAGSRRKWGEFHHIVNPHTLSSPKNIIATWTLAKDALIADALATSLFLITPEKLTPHFSFEYLILYSNNTIQKSSGFIAELFFN